MSTLVATGHGVPVGAVFVHSWGYDQTNIDFYEVVGVTAKAVKIRPVKQTTEYLGSGQDKTVPVEGDDRFKGEPVTKFVKFWKYDGENGPVLRINDYTAHASLWDGAPCWQTAPGWGH